MRRAVITAVFKADVQTVWDVVTDNENAGWRSDLSNIEVLDHGDRFVEYTTAGASTLFTITVKEPLKRYEFDMENKNFSGHWAGIFSETEDGGTKIEFLEEIKMASTVMELFSYLVMSLKKMQEAYIYDLKKRLGE